MTKSASQSTASVSGLVQVSHRPCSGICVELGERGALFPLGLPRTTSKPILPPLIVGQHERKESSREAFSSSDDTVRAPKYSYS